MDETTRGLIDHITVTCDKPMILPDGKQCRIFYDCARLTPNDLARLAATATGHLEEHTFDVVVGLAYSGILFASAIAGGRNVSILQTDGRLWGPSVRDRKVLLVDDVVFTGSRLQEAERRISLQGGFVVGFAAIVNRSEGLFGSREKPLWSAFTTSME